MRKLIFIVAVLLVLPALALAQTERKEAPKAPASKHDTVSVTVHPTAAKNQFRVDFFVVNTEPVAGMPTPVKVSSKKATLAFDSVSFVDGRVEYFQLKTHNADTANQTLLIGLIADLSGTKPPLKPGRGRAFSTYFTADKAITAADVDVAAVILEPANKLEFNTIMADGQVGSTIPTFVQARAVMKEAKKDQ